MDELRACLSVSGAFLLAALLGTAPPVHAQADASRATPPPGRALVFVFRSDRDPVTVQVPVFVNLLRVGDLANGTFVVATVNPGRTLLRFGDQAAPTYAVQAAAGQSYFVRVEALPGAKPARTEVRMVNETDGRRALAQSRLAGAAPPAIAAAAPVPPPPAPAAAAPRVPPPPPAATPAAREAAPSEASDSARKFALVVSTGKFKLANGDQTVAGLPTTFDTASSPVLSVEAEWRGRDGVTWGGEAFYYKNDMVTTSTGLGSKQQVLALMANGKYYFRAADWFYPFVGGGVGLAEATYSGSAFTGNAGGLALQGLAGMEFRFGSVGLHVQYKYLTATTGSSGKQVKVGGSGVLAGVSIAF